MGAEFNLYRMAQEIQAGIPPPEDASAEYLKEWAELAEEIRRIKARGQTVWIPCEPHQDSSPTRRKPADPPITS